MSRKSRNLKKPINNTIALKQPHVDNQNRIVIPINNGTSFKKQINTLLSGNYKNLLDDSNKELFSTFLDVEGMQEAGQGTRVPFVSTLYGNFAINPSGVSVGTFQKMVQTDDRVRLNFEMNIATIVESIGEYYYDEDPEIERLMREQFARIKGGKDELVRHYASCMWAGAYTGLMNVADKPDKNGIKWIEEVLFLPPLSTQYTLTPQGAIENYWQYVYNYPYAGTQNALSMMYNLGDPSFLIGGNGGLGGTNGSVLGLDGAADLGDMEFPFRTNFINTFGLIQLDKERILHLAYDSHTGGINPYGYSLLRDIYPIWLRKTLTVRLYTSAQQRCANPALIGYADTRKVIETGMGQMSINALEALHNVLQSYTEESAILLPGLKGEMFDVEVINYTGDFSVYEKALAYQDKTIDNALFRLWSDEGASYASATTQSSMYARQMKSLANRFEHAILTQFCAYFIKTNFNKDAKYFGRFESKLQNLDDQLKQEKIIEGLVSQGFMSPFYKPDVDSVRKLFGQKELDDKDFNEFQKQLKENNFALKNTQDMSGKVDMKSSKEHYKNDSESKIN
jgi:hypothetical protein